MLCDAEGEVQVIKDWLHNITKVFTGICYYQNHWWFGQFAIVRNKEVSKA